MNEPSDIERTVMRRVHTISVLRPFLSNAALAFVVLALALWASAGKCGSRRFLRMVRRISSGTRSICSTPSTTRASSCKRSRSSFSSQSSTSRANRHASSQRFSLRHSRSVLRLLQFFLNLLQEVLRDVLVLAEEGAGRVVADRKLLITHLVGGARFRDDAELLAERDELALA